MAAILGFIALSDGLGIAPKLNGIVDLCKVISLMFVIYIGGEMAWHREEQDRLPPVKGRHKVIKYAEFLHKASWFLWVLLLIKVIAMNLQAFGPPEGFNSFGYLIHVAMKYVLPILALAPFLGYCCLNGYIAFAKTQDTEDFSREQKISFFSTRYKATKFFMYSNLSVLVPLIIFSAVLLFGFQENIEERNTFLSGVVGVVLFVSSICAKAVEEYNAAEGIAELPDNLKTADSA